MISHENNIYSLCRNENSKKRENAYKVVTAYYSKPERWVFPNLKLTSSLITIRIPDSLLNRVKVKAHQKDIPYQTLIKQFIYAGLGE